MTFPIFSLSPQQRVHCNRALAVFKKKLQNPNVIRREFSGLKAKHMRDGLAWKRNCGVAVSPVNIHKNRYPTRLACNNSRFILNSTKDSRLEGHGYINANVIKLGDAHPHYIATQGPLHHTIDDFWEMVVQSKTVIIVMLTKLEDHGTGQCADYFHPHHNGPREFTHTRLHHKSVQTGSTSLVLREIEVHHKKYSSEGPCPVTHMHYPDWPHRGVPSNALAVREILRRTYHLSTHERPIIVHGSSGIGRTGTFCTIHHTMHKILKGDVSATDIVKTITNIRSHRHGMLETEEQFFFCHSVIVEELEDLLGN